MKTTTSNISIREKLKGIVLEQCPYCNKAHIYKPGKRLPFQLPEMKEYCDSCGTHLDREPGYFLGAMYVSYALAVGQGIITYLLLANVLHIQNTAWVTGAVMLVILLMQNKNFRVARVIWMHLFGY
jgi:uncharacterized protein (DUF983 family)